MRKKGCPLAFGGHISLHWREERYQFIRVASGLGNNPKAGKTCRGRREEERSKACYSKDDDSGRGFYENSQFIREPIMPDHKLDSFSSSGGRGEFA